MYSHGYDWREEPHGTAPSSVLLLLVFMAAAAFLVGMVWLKPWADDGVTAPPPEAQAPAPDDAAAQPPVEAPSPVP